jgi:competence protein ComEA
VRVSRSDRLVIAGVGAAVVVAIAVAWILLAPPAPPAPAGVAVGSQLITATPATEHHASGEIVVDVEGAVLQPGVHALPAGSRVADALAAAGGYSTRVDLAAAAEALNLARALADGEQIHVPAIGENAVAAGSGAPAPSSAGGAGGGGAGGLVNLNTATPEELEALPGIGPVTVQKIVAARQEQPFTSLDDAVTRGVIDRGQLEDISGLATAG